MLTLENQFLKCFLHPKGAAVARLIYRPTQTDMIVGVQNDTTRDIPSHYLGTVVGPVANRIGKGLFALNGQEYSLDHNEANNTLHGGRLGFSEVLWQVEEHTETSLSFHHIMPDGHMGFPGPIACEIRYSLDGAALIIEIRAASDNHVAVNIAPHIYWNLQGSGDISRHELQIEASEYLRLDPEHIPTGEIAEAAGTALDFQQKSLVSNRAFDHHLCIGGEGLRRFLCLNTPNGISMVLYSNQAGVQIYDGRHFGSTGLIGLDGKALCSRGGLAIEPQGYPDAPNHRHFPSVFLDPSDRYHHHSEFHFSH